MFSRLILRRFSSQPIPSQIKDIIEKKPINEYITVNGWVKALRRMKKIKFLDLDDGSTSQKLQVLLPSSFDLSRLSYHSGVTVTGTIKESSHPKQEIELHADKIQSHGSWSGDVSYPFAIRQSVPMDYVRQFQHVRSRTNTFSSILRLRAQTRACLTEHYARTGFLQVDTPILTSNECEGGGATFSLQTEEGKKNKEALFFGKDVFLSVSGQMHLEALANGLSSVYTFNPAFRAEESLGRRHLAEFWMVEAEEAFVEGEAGLEHLLDRVEALVRDTIHNVLERGGEDIKLMFKQNTATEGILREALSKPFARITFAEALQRLSSAPKSQSSRGGDDDEKDSNASIKQDSDVRESERRSSDVVADDSNSDLRREDELLLTELLNGPVFVTHWPAHGRPFYMARSLDHPDKVLCADLLLPGVGEVAGGSVREQNPLALQQRLPRTQNLNWYLQLRQWGSVPTAGYGLGFERLLLFLLGANTVKDVIPFPRWPKHCEH
uniref:Asparagine--tRNA ligase-like n=1 Tax=Hirondellea gigas TaxID=1518452 RepID=A0A2P2I9N4_9CRUS